MKINKQVEYKQQTDTFIKYLTSKMWQFYPFKTNIQRKIILVNFPVSVKQKHPVKNILIYNKMNFESLAYRNRCNSNHTIILSITQRCRFCRLSKST